VTIEARGTHDLIYISGQRDQADLERMGRLLVNGVLRHDYVSGVFINERRIGRLPGALSLAHIGWTETSGARLPDIVVNFASVNMGCDRPMTCVAAIADTPLEERDEIVGAFSRADTWTFMAARGPDFQTRVIDRIPASNADIAATIRYLLSPTARSKNATARVLKESLAGNESERLPAVRKRVIASKWSDDGALTEVVLQTIGSVKYFAAAGAPGWTVGIQYQDAPIGWRWWEWDWPRPRAFHVDITP
jgi:hypothetical protein